MSQQLVFGAEKQRFLAENRETCMYGSGESAVKACKQLLQITPESLIVLLKQADHLIKLQHFDEAKNTANAVKKLCFIE